MDNFKKIQEILKEYDKPGVMDTIKSDIDRNRKGNFSIFISDFRNTRVHVKQISNGFRFGANLFLLDEMETAEKNRRYRENFTDVFNYATLAMYWNDLEPERGKPRFGKDSVRVYRRPPIDLCEEFCLKNNIGMKGHCLNYEPMIPEWAKSLEFSEYLAALETRIQMIAERYGNSVRAYEVTNEIASHWEKRGWTSPLYVDPDVIPKSFRLAAKYLPHNELIINDGQNVSFYPGLNGNRDYVDMIRHALDTGAQIDGIGLQAHLMWLNPEALRPEAICNNFEIFRSEFGLPLQITECTCPSVFDGIKDDDMQAELLEKFYTICFAEEAMNAVIYWNLTDGYAYNAEPGDMSAGENVYAGGLINFDGSRKKAYEVLDRLVNKKWRTELYANDSGIIEFRGFFGNYEITVERDNQAPSVFRTAFNQSGDTFSL